MKAAIRAIEFYLPDSILTNDQLSAEFPEWSVEKIEDKTGIVQRHIAAPGETSMDMGSRAAEKLLSSGICAAEEIDYLIFCTQSPDYYLPTSACLMQEQLHLPRTCGALDINLGCSGYIYGLSLVKGLIETGQAKNILLVTGETYSKFIHAKDKSVRTIFGDGASATLISGVEGDEDWIGPFIFGTDGRGGKNLIVPTGGMRQPERGHGELIEDDSGNVRSTDSLFMDGAEIFTFTLSVIPSTFQRILQKSNLDMEDVDWFVFHQANKYMLDHLRKKLRIPEEKFVISFREIGNTVSSTIPIALKNMRDQGKLKKGDKILLVGFGVGYSWGANLIRWWGE